jgi:hypothetical protein
MKIKIIFIAIVTSLTLSSFSNNDNSKSDRVSETNLLEKSLEEKKEILANYYSNLIKAQIDKQFNEIKDGNINEKEMINSILVEVEYGCAYSGAGCTGNAICGVSRLYAELAGSASFYGENGNGCEGV